MKKDIEILNKIINKYNLGNLKEEITRVMGGLCHITYRLDTSSGTFLVKFVGEGKDINYWKDKDNLERKLVKNNIPGIYALEFNNSLVQEIDGILFYIYPWYEGKSIRGINASIDQTKLMAKYSAIINNIEMKSSKQEYRKLNIDWDKYIEYAFKNNEYIYNVLKDNKDMIIELTNEGNKRLEKMSKLLALSHCDMDYKNVMWSKQDFKLIDMDSLGYANPYMLLFKNALVWSGYEEGNIDYSRFKLFIDTYFQYSKLEKNFNLEDYYYSTLIGIEWLEVNVKRALKLLGDNAQLVNLGLEQVKITIMQIKNYYDHKNEIINIYNN